jgi:hypothetical protein
MLPPHLNYFYDRINYNSMGNRIAKHVWKDETWERSTYYLLDAQGNQVSIYEHRVLNNTAQFNLEENNIYGSSRVGSKHNNLNVLNTSITQNYVHQLGYKNYEFTNHPPEDGRSLGKALKMYRIFLLIFIFTSSIIFSQKKIEVNILDSYKNEINLSNFQKEKQINIHSIKKLKKIRVFEFSNFFCNQGRQLINYNLLPNRISIKYFILEYKFNKQNNIKTYLHCFIYSREKSFFEKCKEVSLSTDCFSYIKAKSKFYYIGSVIGFQNSIVFFRKNEK